MDRRSVGEQRVEAPWAPGLASGDWRGAPLQGQDLIRGGGR